MDTVEVEAGDWLREWVADNPALGERAALVARWVSDPTPREEIAPAEGMALGELLRAFNDTGPLGEPLRFAYRAAGFECVPMTGTCDDIADDRWPQFGVPTTLRVYLADPSLLPPGMCEAADWNFMDAGRPGFLGYAYGASHDGTLYLAGVQSDIAVRYSYLFQGRAGGAEVRVGQDVVTVPAQEMVDRYAAHVPVLRRTFQRYWIQVMLGAATAWALREGVGGIGILRFPPRPEEDVRGHVVDRVYRELPDRIGAVKRRVVVGGRGHDYAVSAVADVVAYLGSRFSRDESAP
ncbi:hypothetical protein [Actinokineospora pegani]|uniref:hypothetical protein n=1 Tax=Actinokineospora pegani TaxID=2654637 RepID=UPI0012EA33CC|nr:hypothetical protein [Actinokineospora pegani]